MSVDCAVAGAGIAIVGGAVIVAVLFVVVVAHTGDGFDSGGGVLMHDVEG